MISSLVENFREIFDDFIFNFRQIEFASEKSVHRSDRFAFAGNYPIEKTQIRINIKRKSVRRHPAFEMHADCRDFAFFRVNAG